MKFLSHTPFDVAEYFAKNEWKPLTVTIGDPRRAKPDTLGVMCPMCSALVADEPSWKRQHVEWHIEIAKRVDIASGNPAYKPMD